MMKTARRCFLTFALLSGFTAQAAAPEVWLPEKTSAVVVGVLSWTDPGLSAFSAKHRKDQELYDTLLKRGVPKERSTLLLDQAATRAAILDALRNTAAKADTNSDFIFYFAGHGVQNDKGRTFITNYDINLKKKTATGIAIDQIANVLKESFKGARVLFLADHCHSGAFQKAAAILNAAGIKAVSLTSSQSSNESTGNWTFSQTIIDTFNGEAFADLNGDGSVTLGETVQEVSDAMKFRENQMSGYKNFSLPENLVLAKAAAANPALKAPATTPPVGSYVLAKEEGDEDFYEARVLNADPNRLFVEFYLYSDKSRAWVDRRATKAMSFTTYPVGSPLRVSWEGKTYDAKVLKVENGFHYVTYPGYDAIWDEWVLSDRILGLGKAVSEEEETE